MSAALERLRSGFTLVETMMVAAIGAIVLTAILSSFMATQNMLRTAMAESELSLAMREMREKLLFKASPDISGNHYGGLLSGSNLNENEARNHGSVEMSGHTVGSSLGSTSCVVTLCGASYPPATASPVWGSTASGRAMLLAPYVVPLYVLYESIVP